MKTKTLKANKVNVVTLGCSKNLFDSEAMMAQLKANEFEVLHQTQDQDCGIVIINTCGFIDSAKEESINTILQYVQAKQKGWVDKVYVTGCLSERYRTDLEKEIPEVDAYFGTKDLPRLLKTLKANYKTELLGERLLTTPSHYAYLKISEGCDRPCSFCAIPLMRGSHVSTPIENLVAQAENLVAKGVKEIILIAQDLTYYGLDIYKKRALADLLRALSDIKGLVWIRLHYAFPAGFPMDVLEVIAEKPNICKYLDMPLQHGSTKILQAMRRGITQEKTTELVAQIREKIPQIALRTTLIVGYPGETQEDFETMKTWVQNMRFDRLGCFTYSHEENTHAHQFTDDVPAEVKQARAEEIMRVQEEISYDLNQKRVGQVCNMLIDRKEGDYWIGRTEFDSPEVDNEIHLPFQKNENLQIGEFVSVKIARASFFDLYAEKV